MRARYTHGTRYHRAPPAAVCDILLCCVGWQVLTIDEYLRRLHPHASERELKVMLRWATPASGAAKEETWDLSPEQLEEIKQVCPRAPEGRLYVQVCLGRLTRVQA